MEIDSLPAPAVEMERRSDGALVLRSPVPLEPFECNLGHWLEHWAREAPERVLAGERAEEGWRTLGYGEARDAAWRIASALLERGLGPDRPVMMLSGNSLRFALISLGALLAGVPVAPVSPAYSLASRDHAKLRHVAALARPGLVFAEEWDPYRDALAAIAFAAAPVVTGDGAGPGCAPFGDLLADGPGARARAAFGSVGPETVVKVLFTSGSTGVPKGVPTTQRMLCSNQQAIRQLWPFLADRPPVVVDWLPWHHTFGGSHNFNLVLRNGGTLWIDPGRPAPGAIEETVRSLRDHAPTLYFNVPAGYQMLLPYLEGDAALRERFFGDLDVVFYAAASLPHAVWTRIERLAQATRGRPVPMLSAWGATETAPLATGTWRPSRHPGAIGLPVPGVEVKLAPAGDDGDGDGGGDLEIRVRGPNVFSGYLAGGADGEAPFDEEGWFRSGDLGALADPDDPREGLVFRGRLAESFKLSTGTWVATGRLRVAVLEACAPVLHDVVVCGQDRDEIGLLAIASPKGCELALGEGPGRDPAASPRLRAFLAERLRAYNDAHPASSTRVARLAFLASPLSPDAGEITDKGYINQRAAVRARAAEIERLYAGGEGVLVPGAEP